jgi:hypothetical protein
MGVSGQLHALAALPWGKNSQYLARKLGRPENQYGYNGEEKKKIPSKSFILILFLLIL